MLARAGRSWNRRPARQLALAHRKDPMAARPYLAGDTVWHLCASAEGPSHALNGHDTFRRAWRIKEYAPEWQSRDSGHGCPAGTRDRLRGL